jgi:hypothetical protein
MAGYVERGVRHLPDGREIDLTEAAWQRRRKALHEREESKCEKCSRFAPLHNSEIAWAGHAHHKHGRKGGDDRIQNLEWCCNFCHFIEHRPLKVIARKEPAA